jgi:MFS family permease
MPVRTRSLVCLAVGTLLVLSTWFSTAAALPGLRAELGLTSSAGRWVGVGLQLGFALGASVSALLGWADRFGCRALASVGALVAAGANAAPLVAPSAAVLLISRPVTGVALALVYAPVLKAAGAWAGPRRGRVLGGMIGALTLGSASPHLVNGLGGTGWRPVLVVTSVAAVLGAVVLRIGPAEAPTSGPGQPITLARIRAALGCRELRLVGAGYIGHVWEMYAGWAAMSALMLHLWGSPRTAGLTTFAVIGVGAIAVAVWSAKGDRIGRERAAILAMGSSGGLVLLLATLVDSPVAATVVALAWGAAVIADSGQFPALVVDHADPDLAGSAISAQMAVGFVLTAVANWVVPAVEGSAGWGWALACLAPGPLLGAVALDRLRRAPKPVAVPAPVPAPSLQPALGRT